MSKEPEQRSDPEPGKKDPGAQEPQPSPEEQKKAELIKKLLSPPEPGHIPDPNEIQENDQLAREYIKALTAAQKKMEVEKKAFPQAAEPTSPKAAETTKPTADNQAKIQRAAGSQVPVMGIRPQPPQKIKEEGSVIVAKALAEQLGTSPEIKGEQRIDERKMAVLDDTTLAALSHFSYRYVYDGVRYWGHITEWWLTGSQGIGGLGRRHILQALANTSGVQSVDKAKSPNVIARNVWDRNWKEKAESEGKVVEE